MNEAALIATEIQDLASSVGDVASAIAKHPPTQVTVNVPEQAAPQVNVNVPAQEPARVDVKLPPPIVNVNVPEQQAPVVNVSPSPVSVSPQINVEAAEPQAYEVMVTERDRDGLIRRFVIQPVTIVAA
ncbi:MAG TPA: hypothetical protein PLB26_17150 [Rubrivivax sp.]|nr:hypothetical protein [Rubrivivax sp.]